MFVLLVAWATLGVTTTVHQAVTPSPAPAHLSRDWTDASGTRSAKATLVRVDGKTLWLQRADGKLSTATLEQLSEGDRQYVATLQNSSQYQSLGDLPRWSIGNQSETKVRAIPAALIYVRVSREFIEDYVERAVNRRKPVHDFILGTRIVGESDTTGKTQIELLPTSGRLAGKISFEGTVHARTRGYNGPVTLHQIADSTFRATKLISLDSSGLQVKPSDAEAPTRITTTSIDSSLPRLRGRIATRIAWSREAKSRCEAERITADHTAEIIATDFDKSTDGSLARLEQVFKSKVPDLDLDHGPMMAEVRFRTNADSIEMAMVRVDAKIEERKLRPPVVEGNPDVALRVHWAVFRHAMADPEVRQDLAPLFVKLLQARSDKKELAKIESEGERLAESTKWSINPDWLALDFKDSGH